MIQEFGWDSFAGLRVGRSLIQSRTSAHMLLSARCCCITTCRKNAAPLERPLDLAKAAAASTFSCTPSAKSVPECNSKDGPVSQMHHNRWPWRERRLHKQSRTAAIFNTFSRSMGGSAMEVLQSSATCLQVLQGCCGPQLVSPVTARKQERIPLRFSPARRCSRAAAGASFAVSSVSTSTSISSPAARDCCHTRSNAVSTCRLIDTCEFLGSQMMHTSAGLN